jgi:redox-sensitive bicupin YhaK (pirin superfamily)
MKMATGKVVGGKVEVQGVTLEEGASVTVLAADNEGRFTLTSEEEAELLLSIGEADRGETVSGEEVLAKLARRHA